jgi:hypothetical protein
MPVFQGGSSGIEMRGERGGSRQSGYASNNATYQKIVVTGIAIAGL